MLRRIKNRLLSKFITRYPGISKRFIDSYSPLEFKDVSWTPVIKPLNKSKVAIVTTAGVHHKDQHPFDMTDPDGDPTFREIELSEHASELVITHDYYDHTDADRDINIVFPVDRLREFEAEGIIGELAERHYGFMGHIEGQHIHTLINKMAPEVAKRLRSDSVDIVLLTPG